ncbi:F-box protein CPR30-like [Chenopodium quinoa]|uniref:F-box protein CPR30-like n=1 Tax=Chenopodium quinoa TaxID=63459 RepID=UPI000B76FAD5|nr:F-box protein CPR30-like [Chenopodium quinoa]
MVYIHEKYKETTIMNKNEQNKKLRAAIPIEIIAEILSRLPVKALLRFQIVCKSWNSLIKSPNFIKIHLNQTLITNSDRHILLSDTTLQWSELDVDLRRNHLSFSELNHPLKPHKGLQLIGSCNGVVCISTISKSEVFLYNPLTNSHRKLPSNPIPVPDLTKMLLGFGYDSKNNDYKVLRIIQGRGLLGNTKNEAQVYSFNDNSWKCIKAFMPQMSLLCVDLTDKEKKKARERANYALDDSLGNLTFKINRLALYKTDTEDKSLKSWLFKISCLACCLLLLLEESLYR